VVATRARRLAANRWFIAGIGLAVLLCVPNVAWQIAHQFPTLEYLGNPSAIDGAEGSVLVRALRLADGLGLVAVPLAVAGAAALLSGRRLAADRPLGIAAAVVLVACFALGAKAIGLAPAYPILFAAGAVVAAGAAFSHVRPWRRTGFVAYAG